MKVKLNNGTQTTRSSFPDVSDKFQHISNWNSIDWQKTVTADDGTKYSIVGKVMDAIIVKEVANGIS